MRIEAIAAQRPMAVQPAQAQAYIHNPLAEFGRGRRRGGPDMARLFSTHPSTDDRIARLAVLLEGDQDGCGGVVHVPQVVMYGLVVPDALARLGVER